MKIAVRSDIFAQVKPKKIHELKSIIDSPNRFAFYDFGHSISKGSKFDLDLKEVVTYAPSLLRFTNQEVYDLLKKSVGVVENTEEYTEYMLNDVFGSPKFVINPPGTLRFYSQNLICFYNGKVWRKIKP